MSIKQDLQTRPNLLGVIEIALGLGIALRQVRPRISGIESLVSVGMFLTTLTFLFTTPGWEPTLGFPGISALPGQFFLKDIVFLGAAVFTASEAFSAVFRSETSVEHTEGATAWRALAFLPFGQRTIRSALPRTASARQPKQN